MSGQGAQVHVHAPHEEAVEHGARSDGLTQRVALTTAILATVGALFGYQAGNLATDAVLLKNDSIARHTQASDQWAYYQAKSTREFIATTIGPLVPEGPERQRLREEAARYGREKADIQKDAERLVAEARRLEAESDRKIHPHERMSLGVTLMQVAVALASITVLTRRRWLFVCALAFAAAGVGVAIWGFASA